MTSDAGSSAEVVAAAASVRQKLPLVIIAIVAGIAVAGLVWYVHERAVHATALAQAKATFHRFDRVDVRMHALARREGAISQRAGRASDAASSASQKRHDRYESLSAQERYDLAHSERLQVEALESANSDLAAQEQSFVNELADLYGDSAVAQLRQEFADLAEARENAASTWWRAASGVEDDLKDELNGGEGNEVSNDSISREYDESAQFANKRDRLNTTVYADAKKWIMRFGNDWRRAKQQVKQLGG